jgi:hypothetical protein
MGINGLLPNLKKIEKKINLKDYQGKRIGIDAHVWIH